MTAKTFGRLRHFGRDKRGASAIEFALLAPLMIGLYIGCVEISEGIAAYRKVTLTAGALANLGHDNQPSRQGQSIRRRNGDHVALYGNDVRQVVLSQD